MKKQTPQTETRLKVLRKSAEEKLRAAELKPQAALSPEAVQKAVHDLQVHQIELEMQNEELHRTHADLEASRERYFDLYNLAPVGYLTLSKKGTVLEANLTAANMLGMEREKLVKQPFSRLILTEDQDIYYKCHKKLFETGAPQTSELRLKKKDGTPLWVRFDTAVATDANGVAMCRAAICDIAAQKQAGEALQAAHEELERRVSERTAELNRVNRALLMLNACNEALLRAKTEAGLLNEVCRVVVEIGCARMAWIGFAENDDAKTVRPVTQVGGDKEYLKTARITWADVPRGRGPSGTAIRTRKIDQCRNLADNPRFAPWRESALQRGYASATALPLLWENQCLGALTIYASQIDSFNPEEIRLLQRLANNIAFGLVALRTRAAHNQLQKELLVVSEREKQLISQELHDGLCQNLAGTAMRSHTLQIRLQAENHPDAPHAREICALLNTGVNEARNLSHGLHPVGPQGEGLMNALAQFAETVRNLFHIECAFECPRRVSIENETISTHLFRIAQEAVNNARRHGEANRVAIRLRRSPKAITLAIEDNGVGFPAKPPKKVGLGLRIMNHRAAEIGAAFSVRRAGKAGGTVVSCRLAC